ncbi:MAG TPA: DUF5130 family protein [Candidatus Avipropionibacterium avicola]|uniref:DUF5130 family protein n=1 Tax=Candidatus Avipropionibacterium avicola TaxID=2840701 RepID=A0A9D1KNJ8_9ACTN|nr:DUF5130 family protein [Candidatus Avipropionibacterium avicola]
METLPYWPEVVEPSPVIALWVILGIPIVIGLGIALLASASLIARQVRRGFGVRPGSWWLNPGSLRPSGLDTDDDSAPYTAGHRRLLIEAARRAEDATGLNISVYLGAAEGKPAEDFAIDLLDSLPDPETSLLLQFDPATEHLELVTGDETDERLSHADLTEAGELVSAAAVAGTPVDGLVEAIGFLARRAGTAEGVPAVGTSGSAELVS